MSAVIFPGLTAAATCFRASGPIKQTRLVGHNQMRSWGMRVAYVWLACILTACAHRVAPPGAASWPPRNDVNRAGVQLIPWPASVALRNDERLTITKDMVIEVPPGQLDVLRIAEDFATLLRPALDATLSIRDGSGTHTQGAIRFDVVGDRGPADESYELLIGT